MNKHIVLFSSIFLTSITQQTVSWQPSNNFPFIPANTDMTKVREMIIEGKKILYVGCGS